jgi:hypothetical protein
MAQGKAVTAISVEKQQLQGEADDAPSAAQGADGSDGNDTRRAQDESDELEVSDNDEYQAPRACQASRKRQRAIVSDSE